MEENKKTAIILGASGLVGSFLLDNLLNDKRYKKVNVYARSPLKTTHKKLETFICDLKDENALENFLIGDEAYCCIGTTKNKTPNKEEYKSIDYGIPLNLAKICRKKNILKILIISAYGANAKSFFFYNRIKGEMEEEVKKIEVQKTYFFRPSVIKGDRDKKRLLESITGYLFSFLPLSLRAIDAKTIAKSMQKVANEGFDKKIISNKDMFIMTS